MHFNIIGVAAALSALALAVHNSTVKRTVIASGTELRILPFGAPITAGYESSDQIAIASTC